MEFAAAATVSTLPLLERAGRTEFASLDPAYARAAQTLSASDWRVFWRMELPLVFCPALAAAGVAFARVMAELAALLLISARLAP